MPVPSSRPATGYLVARLSFANLGDLKAGLRSAEMAAASADVANFGAVTLDFTEEAPA